MNTLWRKIAGDFRQHRLQIGLIALVIMLGTAGVVGALNARAVLQREIARSFAAARSPDLALTFGAVEPFMVETVLTHEDVAAADARRIVMTRSAGANDDWLLTRLTVVRDFRDQRVGVVHIHDPAWPETDGGIFVEQSSWPLLGLKIGEPLRVRTPGGGIAAVPVAGLVHDTAVAPGVQERAVYAFASPEVAARLGQDASPDQIAVKMVNRATGPSRVAADLQEMLADQGAVPLRTETLQTTHPHAVLMETMLRVLGILAIMAFVCSSALAAYVVSLWMKREVRQVGIMKTIGATSGQLAAQYLALVAPVVIAAAALALPLGGVFGDFLIRYNEVALNIDISDWSAPGRMLVVEAVLALAIPFGAMALPILRAARLTAREAIQDPGITAQAAPRTSLARFVRIPGSRQWTFALRNLFRRPWRLAITLTALTTGGAVLLTANFIFDSLMGVVDSTLENQGHDIQVALRRPEKISRLQALAGSLPDVAVAEAWQRVSVRFAKEPAGGGAPAFARGLLTAYPEDTRLLKMPLTAGRWPRADEADAVVIGRPAREASGARLGDTIVLEIGRRPPARLRVVGEFEEFNGPSFYTTRATHEAVAGPTEETAFFLLQAAPGRIEALATAVDLAFISERINAASIDTRAHRREVIEEHFLGVVGICNLVATATALLGAISLAAFGSLNVLERVREIGVIRTLGATPGRVTALFVAESSAVALLSTVGAVGLGMGTAVFLNGLIETQAFKVTIPLVVSPAALGVLASGLGVVLVGVWLPVSRLVRVSVRDALSYE